MNKTINITKLIGIVLMAVVLMFAPGCSGNGSSDSGSQAKEEKTAVTPVSKAEGGGEYARIVNKENPGEEIDVKPFLAEGKLTIVDFYSEYCGPCVRIAPLLKKLDEKRDDIVVIKVDINRPGVSKIDWGSPAATQYKLRGIPHFKIYGTSGALEDEGDPAYKRVWQFIQEAGVVPQ